MKFLEAGCGLIVKWMGITKSERLVNLIAATEDEARLLELNWCLTVFGEVLHQLHDHPRKHRGVKSTTSKVGYRKSVQIDPKYHIFITVFAVELIVGLCDFDDVRFRNYHHQNSSL